MQKNSNVDEKTKARIAKIVDSQDLETYRRIKEVRSYGIPELIQAMDQKQLSVEQATEIARMPKKDQLCVMKVLFLPMV